MLKRIIPTFTRLSFGKPVLVHDLPSRCVSNASIKEKIKRERQERIKVEETYFPTKSFDDLNMIRNFGIIAHIDAGKTTTTERMLYYAGALTMPGEVHEGTTVMDYMQQERDRGITIRAAAITFSWEKHQFNLIDTPGHIDFNAEVERSLRVLDGAIAIFDAVSGVQTQSEIVWLQANKFKVPRLAFVNKMDRNGASLESCVESMKQRLNINPFIMQLPIGAAETFAGVIDIVSMRRIVWTDEMGETVTVEDCTEKDPLYNKALKERERLIETVANYDDTIAEDFLEGKEIEAVRLEQAIRNVLKEHPSSTCAVYVGSSLKNKGIQPLMDGVIKYLPSPSEKEPVVGNDILTNREVLRYPRKDEKLCALAFKVVNDAMKGPLVYVRIYSGTLSNRTSIQNITRNVFEKVGQIFRVRADEYVNVSNLHVGDIAAISGLRGTYSGDTLIDSKDIEKVVLQGVTVPPPVFIASVEYESLKDKVAFDEACSVLTREDPSLSIEENEETGQILVSGLGELHLEIFRDRLETEFKVKTKLGNMKVSYRESISGTSEASSKISQLVYGKPAYAHLDLKIERADEEDLLYINDTPDTSKKIVNGTNVIVMDLEFADDFMRLYNEFKRRIIKKKVMKQGNKQLLQELESESLSHIKYLRNPTVDDPIEELEDEFGETNIFDLSCASFEIFYAIETAINNALNNGSLLGAQVLHTKITITGGSFSEFRSTDTIFEMCTANLMRDLFKGANPVLLEPVMDMEVSAPTTEIKAVMNDIISTRRGKINEIQEEKSQFGTQGIQRTTINAVVPLQETVGYSTFLRSLTKGEAHFLMKFKQYEEVGGNKQREILAGYF